MDGKFAWAVIAVVCVESCCGDSVMPNGDLQALGRDVLRSREKIVSGYFTYTADVYLRGRGPAGEDARRFTAIREVILDGEMRRCDSSIPDSNDQIRRTILCRHCCEYGYHLRYTFGESTSGHPFAVTLCPLEYLRPVDFYVTDPRIVGCFPVSVANLFHFGLGDLREMFAVASMATEVTIDGEPMLKLSACQPNGVFVTIFVIPDKDWAVCRVEYNYESTGVRYFEWVDTQYAYHPEADVWYPALCESGQKIDDVLEWKENLTVGASQINQPVAREVFCFPGMALPVNTVVEKIVQLGSSPEKFRWNGSMLESYEAAVLEERLAEHQAGSMRLWLIVINAILGFVFLAALVSRLRSRR